MILQNLRTNSPFYVSVVISLYYLSKYTNTGFTNSCISFIIVSLIGYFTHRLGHHFRVYDQYKNADNYVSRNSILGPLTTNICYLLDFHVVKHHDSSVNKKIQNVINEFIHNIFFQGGILVLVAWIIKQINMWVIILWTLTYATVHNINYNLWPSSTHQKHHENDHINFGIDIFL